MFARKFTGIVLPVFTFPCFVLLCAREKSRLVGLFLYQVSLGVLQDWNEEMILMFHFPAFIYVPMSVCYRQYHFYEN